MNNKRFISLNLKLASIVIAALLLTLAVYVAADEMETIVANKYYLSDEAVAKNVDDAYISLQKYIYSHRTNGTDTDELQDWIKENDYTYLMVYDNNSVYFDGGWSYSPTTSTRTSSDDSSSSDKTEVEITVDAEERITEDTFTVDTKNRIIEFHDDVYYTYIDVYTEQHLYRVMFFVKLVLCLAALIGTILVYNSRTLGRMIKLSREVQEVSDGNLDAEINPTSNDEIGRLAVNVDNMRNSVVDRLQSEKIAWDANAQLITAMSHDIRTPLTSLIGYLDIIKSGKFNSEEELMKYIDSCSDKALQLKDLSDKLFQYFLVFGSAGQEKELEVYDAGILLQQLLSEHAAELMNYGYNIDFDYNVADVEIKADLSGLRRLFDNVSSNIIKYADKDFHVRISAGVENGQIIVRMINSVLAVSRKVESNKIGLKTCEKICADMGGGFVYKDEGQLFTVRINIPVYIAPKDESADGSVGTGAGEQTVPGIEM